MHECHRQGQEEVAGNSRNKIHQTRGRLLAELCISQVAPLAILQVGLPGKSSVVGSMVMHTSEISKEKGWPKILHEIRHRGVLSWQFA